MLTDSPLTAFARSTLGASLLAAAAVVTVLALLAWIGRLDRMDRRWAAAAAAVTPASAVMLNVILGGLGVWRSTLYTLPPLALVSTVALFLTVGTVVTLFVLSGYRWLARRSRRAPLIYGLLLLAVVAPLILVADTVALSKHYLGFGHGYTIWMDAAVGVVILALPVIAFELLQRRGS